MAPLTRACSVLLLLLLQLEPWMKSHLLGEEELEERLCQCLEAVELEYLLGR